MWLFRTRCSALKLFSNVYNCAPKRVLKNTHISRHYLKTSVYPCYGIFSINKLISRSYCVQVPEKNAIEVDLDLIIKELSDDNPVIENRLKVLMLEVEVLRQDGQKAPNSTFMKKEFWAHLLTLKTKSSRQKYLKYLWKIQISKENRKVKKEASYKEYLEAVEKRKSKNEENKDVIEYSLSKNSMFLRIYDTTINNFYNIKLLQAKLFGEKLIIDCSYGQHMNISEANNSAKQLTLLYADNRIHKNPFDLYLCNCDPESVTMKTLHKNIPIMYEPWYPLNIHSEKFTDLFPREKLVYLTPHCRNEMTSYDPDAIYIIGCMVDKSNHVPLSLAKAKEQKIKMAKFPLDRYLQWGSGSGKSLTINQVVNILLDLKLTGDWNYALRHVPKRKLIYPEDNNIASQFGTKNTFSAKSWRKNRIYTSKTYDTDPSFNPEKYKIPTDYRNRKKISFNSLFDDKSKI